VPQRDHVGACHELVPRWRNIVIAFLGGGTIFGCARFILTTGTLKCAPTDRGYGCESQFIVTAYFLLYPGASVPRPYIRRLQRRRDPCGSPTGILFFPIGSFAINSSVIFSFQVFLHKPMRMQACGGRSIDLAQPQGRGESSEASGTLF
jgi:hypothetical protein